MIIKRRFATNTLIKVLNLFQLAVYVLYKRVYQTNQNLIVCKKLVYEVKMFKPDCLLLKRGIEIKYIKPTIHRLNYLRSDLTWMVIELRCFHA